MTRFKQSEPIAVHLSCFNIIELAAYIAHLGQILVQAEQLKSAEAIMIQELREERLIAVRTYLAKLRNALDAPPMVRLGI